MHRVTAAEGLVVALEERGAEVISDKPASLEDLGVDTAPRGKD
jgi:hypothetical protein